MLRFAHLEFQVFICQVIGLSVLSLELTKTHCLLNGVLDVSLGFIVLPLVHALCRRWAGSELALLNSLSEMVERGSSVGRMPDSQSREPGFESPLLPFRSLGIFFHFTTPQSTQLYK